MRWGQYSPESLDATRARCERAVQDQQEELNRIDEMSRNVHEPVVPFFRENRPHELPISINEVVDLVARFDAALCEYPEMRESVREIYKHCKASDVIPWRTARSDDYPCIPPASRSPVGMQAASDILRCQMEGEDRNAITTRAESWFQRLMAYEANRDNPSAALSYMEGDGREGILMFFDGLIRLAVQGKLNDLEIEAQDRLRVAKTSGPEDVVWLAYFGTEAERESYLQQHRFERGVENGGGAFSAALPSTVNAQQWQLDPSTEFPQVAGPQPRPLKTQSSAAEDKRKGVAVRPKELLLDVDGEGLIRLNNRSEAELLSKVCNANGGYKTLPKGKRPDRIWRKLADRLPSHLKSLLIPKPGSGFALNTQKFVCKDLA